MKQLNKLCNSGSATHYSHTKGVLSSSSLKKRYLVLHLVDSKLLCWLFSIEDIVAFSILKQEKLYKNLKMIIPSASPRKRKSRKLSPVNY